MPPPINVPLNAQVQNTTQLTQQIQAALNAARLNLGNGSRAFSSLSQPLGRLTGQADEFSKSMEAANARVLAFGASVGVVNAVSNAFKALVASTIEVEKALKEISIVGDQFGGDIKNLGNGIFDIAKKTGQGFAEVSKAALEFARQGLNMEDTLQRTQDALILTRTTGLDAAKSVEGLTAAVNGFSKAGLTTTQILNKLAAVDQAFAVSSADLIEGFNRSAAVAQNAGVTFDELAGIITALQQETSRGGAVIGNALKTIFTRLQDTSTLTQLQDLGVAVTDLQGNLLPARQILQNLATDLQGLGQITKAGIFKDVAGTFQINQLISLVGDLNKEQSVAAAATRKSASATNEAYVANEKLNQSLDAILNKVAQTGKQLGSILGELGLSDSLKGILETINSFLDGANKLLQGDDIGSKFAKGFVKGIGSVLTGPGLLVIGAVIVKLSADLLKFGAQSLKVFFGIGQAAREQKQVQESIVQTLLSNQSVLNTILNTQGGQNAQALKFLGILNQQQAAMKGIQTLAAGIAGTAYGAGYRPGPGGLARRSAGGYLPAQEAADVRRGVGGASPSSKVVAIPNFAFGGGKRGTMIANTSEYIVPNYAGGGSAIFNQDMVNSMGLPAGAKKISAAGGFIPNFARTIKDVGSRYALITNDIRNEPRPITVNPEKDKDVAYQLFSYGIPTTQKVKSGSGGAFQDSRFTNSKLIEKYTELALNEANAYSMAIGGNALGPYEKQKVTQPGVVAGLVGSIFENGIAGVIKGARFKRAQAERKSNAIFDFFRQPSINKTFGIPKGVNYIEAKYTDASKGNLDSLANKIYNAESGSYQQPEKSLSQTERARLQALADKYQIGKSGKSRKEIKDARDIFKRTQDFQTIQAYGIKASARGYIPNFAASALQQAIAREKSAGLSNSQIYVDQNPSLKSPLNPMGLMVANTRDEPFGGAQGIARARKEGANPKTYGAAGGFVPNYAPVSGGSTPIGLSTPAPPAPPAPAGNPNPTDKVNKSFGDLASKVFILQSALTFFTSSIGEGETSLERFTQQLAQSSGNITSAAFTFQQISGTETKGAFGKFAKNLGLVGTVAFGAYEAFKLIDFGFKEFSGQNKRTADALAKLETAVQGAAISLEDLSPEGQRRVQETGKATLESFSGSFLSNLLTEAAGKNPEIQKQTGLLAAQGLPLNQLKPLLENEVSKVAAERLFGLASRSSMARVKKENLAEAGDVATGIQNLFDNPQVVKAASNLATIREGVKSGRFGETPSRKSIEEADASLLDGLDPAVVDSIILKFSQLQKTQAAITADQRRQALGEKVSIELAKLKLDTLIEQKKQQIDLTTNSGTEGLRLQLETLNVSESYRNELEKQIKLKEIDGELSKTNLDLVSQAIEKLSSLPSESVLGVSAEQFESMAVSLQAMDIKTAEDLQEAIGAIGKSLELQPEQLTQINNLFTEQFKKAKDGADAQKLAANNTFTFTQRVIESKNALEATRLLTEKIASDLERASKVQISIEEVQIGSLENQAKLLRERASATQNTSEQRSLNKQAIELDKKANDARAASAEKKYQSEKRAAELRRKTAFEELQRRRAAVGLMGKAQYSPEQIAEAQTAYADAEAALKILDNTQQKTRESFDATAKSLDLQAQAIYRTTSAWDSYRNTILQFYESAGERIASADIGILSATDPTSLANATIQRQVEMRAQNKGLQGEDYYKFVTQGVELEKKRFELSSETSNVRRVELQNELDLMNQISEISAATDEERLAKIKEIIQARTEENQSFGAGFTRGIATLRDKTENFKSEIGQQIPELFASNLAQGLNDALSGAKSLKAALQDAAISFLNAISQASMQNLANKLVVGISGLGNIGKASGGLIKGGSGTKDDVPAMLMGGEYVIKKSAVNKYGSSFLNALNKGQVKGFAKGGGVQSGAGGFYVPGDYGEGSIRGKSQLLAFAGQSFTSGQYDQMGGFGSSGAFVNLEAESARLTTLGRENSPLFERVQQTKEEAFKVYLEQLNQEKQYRDQLKQFEEAQKQREKQLTSALIQAAASVALNVVGSAAASGFKNAAGIAKANNQGIGGQFTAGLGGIFKGGGGQGGLGNLFSGNFSAAFNSGKNIYGGTDNKQYMGYTLGNKSYPYQKRASGGYISGGSGVRDDVPAMLTGGEFVLNNRATRKLGVQNLNRLNSGESGGGEDRSAAVTESLLSKLDELIQATRESSGDNVVVNVSSSEAGNASNENGGGNERDLQRKIRAAVLEVIAQEKRLGGSLNKNNR